MINVKQLFFCDEFQQSQFGKYNILGMLPSRKINLNEVPYIFCSTLVLDGLIDPGEYNNEVFLKITDLDSGVFEKIPFFILNGIHDKIFRLIRWFPINIYVVKYVSIKISVMLDNDEELYSEIFEFRPGQSPSLMIDLKSNILNSSGLLGPNVTTNIPEILVRLAHKELIIIDQYLTDDYLASLLAHVHPQTKITVLVGIQLRTSFSNINISTLNNPIEIRFSPKVPERFHDRFIILNGTEVYHLGYSLKDLNKQISRYCKVINSSEANEIIGSFNSIWTTSIPL